MVTMKDVCKIRVIYRMSYKIYDMYTMVIVLWLWPGFSVSGPVDQRCDRCQVKAGINCTVTELPYPCFLPESDEKDFPHQPRDVMSDKHLENNTKWHLHLSWKLPYDYSYSVVTGFEMVIDSLIPMARVKVQPMRCFHINLNDVDWSAIDDVHNLEFQLDCLEYNISQFTRNLVVTLYSLPKAAKNSDYTSHKLTLPGEVSNMDWSPRIQIESNATGLIVKVSPPFKTAAYHVICVENQNNICMGGMLQVNKTNERYLQGFIEVPSNQTYQIMIKPFDKHGNKLDVWVTRKNKYFYQPILPEVIDGPVRERLNYTSTLPPPELTQSNHTVLVILLVIAITCLLFMFLIFFFLHRNKCTKKPFKFLQKICQGEKKGEEERFKHQIADKPGVAIIPIFLRQPEKEKRMVEAHLTLLEKQDGITIKPTPFLSDLKLQEVEEGVDISTWVDEQINMAVQHDNHYFIVYTSENIKIILTEPDIFPENPADQICIRFIQKLTSQNFGKKVLGVYFGKSVDYNCLPFTKFYRMFPAVKEDSEELHPPPVSFSGTVDLINCLLASQTDKQYSLNSEETRNLRSIFSQQFMSRSLDAITTGYESESSPFIQDNRTFVSPDSIAGSQHSDLNAEMDGLNRRAGWPDVC